MAIPKEEVQKIMRKYTQQLDKNLGTASPVEPIYSRHYQEFREEYQPPHLNLYEKACKIAYNILKIRPDQKSAQKIQQDIEMAHLNITPGGVLSLAIFAPLIVFIVGALLSFLVVSLIGAGSPMFFILFFLIIAAAVFMVFNRLPSFLAVNYRLKASNQMVQSVFYVVTFMRHTSNLERAINFAADHVTPPLALDLKKVLWDVETGKFDTVIHSLEAYLETWKTYNKEFVEAFHLIESSLYVPSEARRLEALDKALNVILDGTYEKMLHYAQNLKSPITTLFMMGVILPVLGLVILPLITTFMSKPPNGTNPYILAVYIGALYVIALPAVVYFLGKKILASRPTGYGAVDVTDINPKLKKYKKVMFNVGNKTYYINPAIIAIVTGCLMFILGLSPVILHAVGFGGPDEVPFMGVHKFFDYKEWSAGTFIGPYGLGATLISMIFPLALGLSAGLYYHLISKNVIKIRKRSKELEAEFASALFQLGNRLADGVPAELAFQDVSKSMTGTVSAKFFNIAVNNMRNLGMGIEESLFDEKIGAIKYFPSSQIISAMKVLVESAKRGPLVASKAMINISKYIKQMHKVNERLKDLLAEVLSSMKSQIRFMTPIIAGIVVGITSMITTIVGQLTSGKFSEALGEQAAIANLLGFGVPSYFFVLIVGAYVVLLIYILTVIVNGIENGADVMNERYLLSKNMVRATLMFVLITSIVTLAFNFIAGNILASLGVS
ncbi:hypothetical protein DRJ17_01395 [Candidatus Woesearchaeota archaeon]|nr:MAG: hypothetical protein DRJ17_01395 [Candidatus Woesearchaeota archaeon]